MTKARMQITLPSTKKHITVEFTGKKWRIWLLRHILEVRYEYTPNVHTGVKK